MDYNKLIQGIKRFGSTEQDICTHGLGVAPEFIKENVVIAPWWEPNVLPGLGQAEMLTPPAYAIGVWNIKNEDENIEMTYIKPELAHRCF